MTTPRPEDPPTAGAAPSAATEVLAYVARREAALDRVRDLLITRLHVDRAPFDIDPDAPLFGTGLGLDSVDAVELVVAMEDTLGIRLPDETLGRRQMRTVGKLVDLLLAIEDARPAPEAPAKETHE